ncbi:MAG: hypothetical protein WD599_04485 [Balneolaceae bacterium]
MTVLVITMGLKPGHAQPDPAHAFLRSVLIPGWGHHYVDKSDWVRGQVHLAAEAGLIASLFGLYSRAGNLETQYQTLASLHAGVDVSERDRLFRLAVGDFDSLDEYNDYHLRSRNWNRLLDYEPENRWNWESANRRSEYRNLRSKVDRTEQQIPALISLMIVNRVVSGISAWLRARQRADLPRMTITPVRDVQNHRGVVATVSFGL